MCAKAGDDEIQFFRGVVLCLGKRYLKTNFLSLCIDNKIFIYDGNNDNVVMVEGNNITLGGKNADFVTKKWTEDIQKISNFTITNANSMTASINELNNNGE